MTPPQARYTAEEATRLGQSRYEREIRPHVEPQHKDRYLVMDIETADYEIGDDYLMLSKRMRAKKPDAALYALRIGHRTLGRVGSAAAP